MNTLSDTAEQLPANMIEGVELALGRYRDRTYHRGDASQQATLTGLRSMEEIRFEYNTFLDATVLQSLFGSDIIPKRLTRLEIVNCPNLNQVYDFEAIATLLQRSLQLLQFLKLHFLPTIGNDAVRYEYDLRMREHPGYHPCNIVRELGQKIKGLDLALPLACNRIFVPPIRKTTSIHDELPGLPEVSETPVNTLPQRLMDSGYRYRRLIFNKICRKAHGWDEMAELAGNQGEKFSWELLHDSKSKPKAMWFVSGCSPVEFDVAAARQYPFDER